MPKLTYDDYLARMQVGYRTAVRFYQQGNNFLKSYLQKTMRRMDRWAGQDQDRKNQIAALRGKMEQIISSLTNLSQSPGDPADRETFNKYIRNFDMLQEVLQSECRPGGDTVFREMVNIYHEEYPRYPLDTVEKEVKEGIGYTTDVVFGDNDPDINYEKIDEAQAIAESKKEAYAKQEEERKRAEERRAAVKYLDDKIANLKKDPEAYKKWLSDNQNGDQNEKQEWLKGHGSDEIDRLHYGEKQLTDEMLKGLREREKKEWNTEAGTAVNGARYSSLIKLYENLYNFHKDLNDPKHKDYDPAEADKVLKLADAIKYMGQGLDHGSHDNVYEDMFTQGWETMQNECMPVFSQQKGDKTWFGWLQDKLVERGSYSPTTLNSAFDILVNDYKIPISDELRNTGIVYSGMAGKMIQSYQKNGSNAKSLDKLITDLTAKREELKPNGDQQKESETILYNQMGTLLEKAQILKTCCTDPSMKDRAYRTGDGKSIVTAAVRSFNNELSSLEDRCGKTSFRKNFGEFFDSWRQSKYEIKRDNVQDKTRTWKSYLEFHTGENADGREEEYLAKACVAWKHANEIPQKKFSLKTARKEAADFMKQPEYQALILDRKVTKNLLRNRRFDLIATYLQDPYSYGTEDGRLKDALRNLKTISSDLPLDAGTDAEKNFKDSLQKIRELDSARINNMSHGEAAKLLQEASVGASAVIASGQANLKSDDGRKFMNIAIDASVTLGDSCNYGKHLMQGNLKTAAAQFKTAGLKLESKLYGMKGREERKKIEEEQEKVRRDKEKAAEEKRLEDLKKSAGKDAKLAYQVKAEDIAKLPKAGPLLKDPIDVTGRAEKLRGRFDGTVGIPDTPSFYDVYRLMNATAFNDNGKVVVDGKDYNRSALEMYQDSSALRKHYFNDSFAWKKVKEAAKNGGDFIGLMKQDLEALKKPKEQEVGPQKGM